MPLSDDEQRILREIEHQLSTDEKFASAVSSKGLYSHSARNVRWAVLGMVVCLAGIVLTLQVHFILAFVAFVAFVGMLSCALVIERQVRLMGRAGVQDLVQRMPRPRAQFPRD